MTEENKKKLEWLIENVSDIHAIYVKGNIDVDKEDSAIHIEFKDRNSETLASAIEVCIDYVEQKFNSEYKSNRVWPYISYKGDFTNAYFDNYFSTVYKEGRWLV